jgi:hypothetical protein
VIKIECDNCERTFEVDDEQAGGKAPCPHCDDVNRVPARASRSPVNDEVDTDRDEEREICVVRPGMFRARPFRYLFILLLIGGGIALAIWSKMGERDQTWLAGTGLVLSAFSLGWFCMWWLTTHFWVKLVVTNKRSIRQEGIIKRHTTEVLHDHIRSVDIRQTLLQRMLAVGNLDIDSAGQAGDRDIEIEMNLIPRPYEVKKIIDQYRKM